MNSFNLNQFLNQFSFANSLSSELLQRSLSGSSTNLLNDYSNFEGHIFFGNATRKSTVVINEIIDQYPIGISGSATSSLSADKVAEFENWSLSADGFTKFALDFICGATSNFLSPTITSSASSYNSDIITLNVIERDTDNNIVNLDCAQNINTLLETATLFDEGIARTKITSGTGSDQFVIPTYDDEIIDYVIPEKIRTSVNRNMSLEKYMTHQTPFFIKDDELEVFQRLVCIIADFFDSIKEYIDQFSNIYNFQYSDYNRSPEGLIQYLTAKQFGLELFEGAIAGQLPEYFIKSGKKGLQKLTYEIWNRVLNDISSLYKGKGTKFAFNQLMRNFGFYEGFLSAREYIDHLETGTNTYEKNINVKIPQFGSSGFNVFKIQASNTSTVSAATVMFSVFMPNINDYVGGDFEIANIFGNRFIYDSTNEKYKIQPAFTSITSSFDVWSDENDVQLLNGYLSTQLTPFIVSINGYAATTGNSTAIINIETLDSLSGNFTTSAATLFSGLSISSLNFASNTGNYFLANTKLFTKVISTNEYLRNQHIRLQEDEMVCDYKLYDVPTTTALNSYINSFYEPITGVTGSVTGGVSSYDIIPINFKRDWESTGIISLGGDFIVEDESTRTGSNNLGIGLFSSEAINNDILDFYGSSSATNITAFYLDPQVYYNTRDKRKWENLESHRGVLFSSGRYPEGIKYDKFMRLIYAYRFILSNFFNTMEQFLRFKSKIVQKGVNIEQSFLERDKTSISSIVESTISDTMLFNGYESKDFFINTYDYGVIDAVENFSGTATIFGNFSLCAATKNLNSISSLTSSLFSITGLNSSSISSSTSSLFSLTGLNFSSYSSASISVSGFKTISGDSYSFSPQGTTGTQIDRIGYKGVKNSPFGDYSTFSISSNSLSTAITINKNVLETSDDIFIPLTGTLNLVYWPTSNFVGLGETLTLNFTRNSYLSGINISSPFSASNTASYSGGEIYFISTYNGTVPISGSLSASSISGATAVGVLQATILENNFKDIGSYTESGYYRKIAKANIKLKSKNVNTNLTCKRNVFEINNSIDPYTKLPLFNFYCFNDNKYYRGNNFKLPVVSKNGIDLLISVNPIFNNMDKGKHKVEINNLLDNSNYSLDFNVINSASNFTDETFTRYSSNDSSGGSTVSSTGFTLNSDVITLTDVSISAGYVNFGTQQIDEDKGIVVYLNGTQQDKDYFWTYTYSGGNKLNFITTTSLSANDIISVFYYY